MPLKSPGLGFRMRAPTASKQRSRDWVSAVDVHAQANARTPPPLCSRTHRCAHLPYRTVAQGGPLGAAAAAHKAALAAREVEEQKALDAMAAARPGNVGTMSLEEAVVYMWSLDKPQRIEREDGGFQLDMQGKRDYNGADRCEKPLFKASND